MYGIYKIKQLWVDGEDLKMWISLDNAGQTITAKIPVTAMCTDFADAMNRLGLYNVNTAMYWPAQYPSELIGVEVQGSVEGTSKSEDNSITTFNEVRGIELTPSGYTAIQKYLNKPSKVNEMYNDNLHVFYERPGGNGSITEYGKFSIKGNVFNVYDGDTFYMTVDSQEGSGVDVELSTWAKKDQHEGTKYITIRCLGINTPELKVTNNQEYNGEPANQWGIAYHLSEEEALAMGKLAADTGKDMLLGRNVTVYIDTYSGNGVGTGRDKYGRYLGIVYFTDNRLDIGLAGTRQSYVNYNVTMLMRGLAEPLTLKQSDGTVMSDYPVNLWSFHSPYYSHLSTKAEQDAKANLQRDKVEEANLDMAGKLSYVPQSRRVNTITNYIPDKSRHEDPEALADLYGCTVKELLELNGLPLSVLLKTPEDYGWYNRTINIPVYDKPEDHYSINISAMKDLPSPMNPFYVNVPEPWLNQIPCPANSDKIPLPTTKSPYHLRLGDVEMVIPPLSIKITEVSQSVALQPLRSKTAIRTQSGHINRMVEIQLYFHDINAINGYPTPNPDPSADDKYYYMDGLRPLIAEFKKTPFVPVWNERLESMGIFSVGLKTIKIETLPNFPHVIGATIQLIPFNHIPYIPQYETLASAINWPIFRWYYQQSMQPRLASKRMTHTFLRPMSLTDHTVSFQLANEDELAARQQNLKLLRTMATPNEYAAANGAGADTVQGHMAYDYEQLDRAKTQYDRFVAAGYEDKDSKGRIVDQHILIDKVYGQEKVVFYFPEYKASMDVQTGQVTGYQSICVAAWAAKVPTGHGFYLFDLKSEDLRNTLKDYEVHVPPGEGWGNVRLWAVGVNDTSALDRIAYISAPAMQDIENYKKKYETIEDLVYGMESQLPMDDWAIEDLVIVDMQAVYENMFVPMQVSEEREPSLQHLGGQDIVFNIHIQTTNRDSVSQLAKLFEESQRLTRDYRTAIVSGFLGIRSGFSDIFGIDAVLFDSFEVVSVPGQPDVIDIRLSLVGFNKQQKRSELLDKTEGIDVSDVKDKMDLPHAQVDQDGYEPIVLEQKLKQMELYPDLELPTYSELNRALPYIGAGVNKVDNPNLARFVEPDFYIAYDWTYQKEVIDAVNNVGSDQLMSFKDDSGAGFSLKVPKNDGDDTSPTFDENAKQLYKDNEAAMNEEPKEAPPPSPTSVSGGTNYGSGIAPTTLTPSSVPFKKRSLEATKTPWGQGNESFIQFLASYGKLALQNHVLPSLMIAQACLESGYGDQSRCNNLFCITCSDNLNGTGTSDPGWHGDFYKISGNGLTFKAYDSYEDSIFNYIDLVGGSSIYSRVRNATNSEQATQAVFDSGYTGDYGYVSSLRTIIAQYGLSKYDNMDTLNANAGYRSQSMDAGITMALQNQANSSSYSGNDAGISTSMRTSAQYALEGKSAPKPPAEPSYGSDIYLQSVEWMNAVAAGRCYTQFGDQVVSTIDVSKASNPILLKGHLDADGIWTNTFETTINSAVKSYIATLESENADLVQAGYGGSLFGSDKCLELYDLYVPTEGIYKGESIVQCRISPKSNFEGKYWRHTPPPAGSGAAGMTKNASVGPMRSFGPASTTKALFDDMMEFDKRGRLVRAFPAFHMLLIDEGRWMAWYKMWDNFYGFSSILSIDVMKSRKMAADTLVMTMSNIYNNVTQRDVENRYTNDEWKWWNMFNANDGESREKAWDILLQKPTDEMIKIRKEAVHQLALKPGARVHLRLGYGSNAYELPIVFNGTITECDVQEQLTIVAQGDGIELAHKIPDARNNDSNDEHWYGTITEPRDFICGMLTRYGGAWSTFFNVFLHGNKANPEDNLCNIVHFGQNGWLPPATHPRAQEMGRVGAGFVNFFRQVYNQSLHDQMAQLLEEGKGESSFMVDVYGMPWDDYGEPGLNVYRSAGIPSFSETFYTQAGIDKDKAVGPGSEIGVKGRDIFGEIFWNLVKGVAGWFTNVWSKGDEPNIEVYLYDRSVWDVANAFAKCVPDYIVATHPFELRSTLFFGRPQWGLAYKYEYRYIFNEDSKRVVSLVHRATRKPFMQFHSYHSYLDIIDNKIRASADNVYTNVIVTYPSDGTSQATPESTEHGWFGTGKGSDIVHADTDIYAEFQKTAIINIDIVKDRTDKDGKYYSEHAGVNLLKDFMKDMYDGELIVMGDPSLKPHDLFYIEDNYIDMKGYAQVKQVIHHFSFDTGFTSSISPDCIVEGENREVTSLMSWLVPSFMGVAAGVLTRKLASTAWRKLFVAPIDYINTQTEGGVAKLVTNLASKLLGTRVQYTPEVISEFGKLSELLIPKGGKPDFDAALKLIGKWKGTKYKARTLKGAEGATKALDAVEGIIKAYKEGKIVGKASYRMASLGSLIKVIGAETLIGIAVDIAVTIVSNNVIEAWARKRRNRQAVMIVPLKYQGTPFTAGVNGSRGLIQGTAGGFWDKFFATNPMMKIIDGLFGIDTPEKEKSE